MTDEQIKQAHAIVTGAQRILVIQADNPDADSLGSAVALEQLLSAQGKQVFLYCGIHIPDYLHHVAGWDRVSDTIPSQFDASIIVDTSAHSLLHKLEESGSKGWVAAKPCLVLDHHAETENDIPYATLVINSHEASSTGELIYDLARAWEWSVDVATGEAIMSAILGDTQGLTNESTTDHTYDVMAELVRVGVSRPRLEELRREYSKMDPRIFRYKADLIRHTDLAADGKVAIVTVPQNEINDYSPLYNPAPLIQGDMLQTIGVQVAIVLKHYDDGKILASIRCNQAAPVASDLALKFGGGGHPHAAGFKLTNGRPINEVKSECIKITTELLANLDNGKNEHETPQYAYTTG